MNDETYSPPLTPVKRLTYTDRIRMAPKYRPPQRWFDEESEKVSGCGVEPQGKRPSPPPAPPPANHCPRCGYPK